MAAMIGAYFLRCDQERQYRGYVGQIENTLKANQSYVGGLIQAVSLTPEIIVICNDEGKIQQIPVSDTVGTNLPAFCPRILRKLNAA